jgi:hypothetical protein
MARLKEIVSDTLGITAAKQGVEDAGGMFYENKRLGKILNGSSSGIMQVMEPNYYYDLTSGGEHEHPRRKTVRELVDAATFVGAVALATLGGQPEIAIAAKVVYNAVSAGINRNRASRSATAQA